MALTFLLVASSSALAQPTSSDSQQQLLETLQKDMEMLKAGQKTILYELQELKKLLATPRDDRSPLRDINLTMRVTDTFAIGDAKATLTLVEFTDYQ